MVPEEKEYLLNKTQQSPDSVRLPDEIGRTIAALEQQKNAATQRQLDILGAYWLGIGAGTFNPAEWDFKDNVGTRKGAPAEQEVSAAEPQAS
jgi:hypothetical protein